MIQKAASKTTPLVEKEGKTVTDYTAYEVVQKYKKFVMTQFFK